MKSRSDTFRTFAIAFVGGLTALAAWRLVPAVWPFVWPLLLAVVLVLVALNVVETVRYWRAGRKGLDQWPDPHGRFYNEWLSLPREAGDYYEWLSNRMGDREPWSSWALRDRQLESTPRRTELRKT